MKNYGPEYFKSLQPLQNYYSNMPSDSKQNAQIKRYSISNQEFDHLKTFLLCQLISN